MHVLIEGWALNNDFTDAPNNRRSPYPRVALICAITKRYVGPIDVTGGPGLLDSPLAVCTLNLG